MSTATKIYELPPPAPAGEVSWRSWPLREGAATAWLVAGGMLVVALLVRATVESLTLSLLAAGAVGLSLWRYFVPIRYTVNRDGVSYEVFRRLRRIPWSAIATYEVREHGVLLYPHPAPNGLDLWRSLYLPTGSHTPEVLGLLLRYGGRRG